MADVGSYDARRPGVERYGGITPRRIEELLRGAADVRAEVERANRRVFRMPDYVVRIG